MSTDRRGFLRSALLGAALLVPGRNGVRAAGTAVSDAAGLARTLAAATGGETIRLAPGDYGVLDLRGDAGPRLAAPVTLTSADPADPAVFAGARVSGVAGLVLDGLRFEYRPGAGDPVWASPFGFGACRDLVIRNTAVRGEMARGISPDEDGFGWGTGLSIRGCSRVILSGNRIDGFNRALTGGDCSDVVIADNELTGMRSDAMTFASMQGLRIEGNYLHGFRRAWRTNDHCDMIQFWTEGTTRPSTDIVIRGNLLQAGDGDPTQSIFMRNELVDTGRAGPEMFYRNITIEDNAILNGHLHGITLGEASGVVIQRNTVLRDPAFDTLRDRINEVYIPRINLRPASVDVVVRANIASQVPAAGPGWAVTENLVAQDVSRLRPGHYHLLFAPRPSTDAAARQGEAAEDMTNDVGAKGVGSRAVGRSSLVVRPGGGADRPGLGSPLMR